MWKNVPDLSSSNRRRTAVAGGGLSRRSLTKEDDPGRGAVAGGGDPGRESASFSETGINAAGYNLHRQIFALWVDFPDPMYRFNDVTI